MEVLIDRLTSTISKANASAKSTGLWARFASAMEDAGLSYSERLERRIGALEKEVQILKQRTVLQPIESEPLNI